MGTWLGHAAPGTFFLGMGIWWMFKTYAEYLSNPESYTNRLGKACSICGKLERICIQSVALLILAIMGISAEIITGSTSDVWPQGNTQHATMYFGFGLVGLVDLMQRNKIRFIPQGSEYMTYILALGVELVLFRFHLHDRKEVDQQIHMLLVYTIMCNIAAAAAEFYYPKSIHAGLTKNYFTILQGTWFVQIAFTLYNPVPGYTPMDMDNPENIMIITTYYAWHMLGCALATLVIGGICSCCCSSHRHPDSNDLTMSLLPSDSVTKYADYRTDEEEELWSSQHTSNQTATSNQK